uniref:Uncharacterized protein n=1 Tax=Oryza glaberrima TaxID=4538 RepID=I1NVU2_ORYGL
MEFTLSELEEDEVDSKFDKQPAPLAWLEERGGRQRVEIWECHLLDVDEAKVQCFDSLLHNAYVVTSYSSSTVLSSSNSLTVSYPSSLQRDGSNDSRRTSAGRRSVRGSSSVTAA